MEKLWVRETSLGPGVGAMVIQKQGLAHFHGDSLLSLPWSPLGSLPSPTLLTLPVCGPLGGITVP